MKRIIRIIIVALLLITCKKPDIKIGKIEPSTGAVNEVVVVIEDSLWNASPGDSIRNILAAPVAEISAAEPTFDLAQYSPRNFDYKAKRNRNIIQFSADEAYQFLHEKSLYASPQNFFFIRESNPQDMIELFISQSDSIIKTIKQTELNERQLFIARQPLKSVDSVKKWFALTIKVPNTYEIKLSRKNEVVWFQKKLPSGDINILIYEVAIPEEHIDFSQNIDEILEMRDVIIGQYIYGNQMNSYVYTDYNFVPVVYNRQQKNLPAIEIRGKWAMENDFMTGPFISLVIKDEYYERYLFLDGFVNNSFQSKRNPLIEVEAIIKSINFYE